MKILERFVNDLLVNLCLLMTPGLALFQDEAYTTSSLSYVLLHMGLDVRKPVFRGLFVCFIALRSKSTAMVIAARSVHLTTLFPGQA